MFMFSLCLSFFLSLCSSSDRVFVERKIKEQLREVMSTEDLDNITTKQVE